MRLFAGIFVGALICSVVTAVSAQESIGTEKIAFTIKYNDGTIENSAVKYQAMFKLNTWETGGPADLSKGKFIDDRQCHWAANSYIQRDTCTISRRLGEKCEGAWRKVFDVNHIGVGTDHHIGFDRVTLQGENCLNGSVQERIAADVNRAKQQLISEMHNVMKTDIDSVLEVLRNAPDIVEVRR